MATACGGLAAADPAAPGMPLRDLSQWAADALGYFASTAQCGEIAGVVARDAARTDADGTVFSSPLQLIDPPCPAGTVVSFWAHYDDDLIFANPALQQAFDNGQCLRTLFFTGSDAGAGNSAVRRESRDGHPCGLRCGARRIGPMARPDGSAAQRRSPSPSLSPKATAGSRSCSCGWPTVDVNGTGYQHTGWESLNELITGDLPVLHTLDTDAEVTLDAAEQHGGRSRRGLSRDQVLALASGFRRRRERRPSGSPVGRSDRRRAGRRRAHRSEHRAVRDGLSDRETPAPTSTATRSRAR